MRTATLRFAVLLLLIASCTETTTASTVSATPNDTIGTAELTIDRLEEQIESLATRVDDLEGELRSSRRDNERLNAELDVLAALLRESEAAQEEEVAAHEQRLAELRELASLPDDPEIRSASATLERFLALMRQGAFAEASEFYGGEYETLSDWNPTVPSDDPVALLEASCLQLRCDLEVRRVLPGELEPPTFEFWLQFTEDGELFERGPCCGDDSGDPAETQFRFIVERRSDGFEVLSLPVYVP